MGHLAVVALHRGPVGHARGISVLARVVARTVVAVARGDRSVAVLVGAVAGASRISLMEASHK